MRRNVLAACGAVVVVGAAIAVVVNQRAVGTGGPGTGDPTSSTGPAGPTVPVVQPPPVVGTATCEDLKAAAAGSTITVGGAFACDVKAAAPDVTVTGTATGWLRCRNCDRWHLSKLRISGGDGGSVVHMIGGDGWTIEDSDISGQGGPGNFGVVAVGETPENGPATNWTIRRSTIEAPGNNAEHQDNQDHALYVIGPNQTALHGLIEDNEILGGPAGQALKVGGTGNLAGQSDSSDSVTVRRNHIVGRSLFDGSCSVVISTNSDDVSLLDNRIECPDGGVPIALSEFTGKRLVITGNAVAFTTQPWILAQGVTGGFDNQMPFECGRWATCSGNRRG